MDIDLEALMENLLDNGYTRKQAMKIIEKRYGLYSREDNPWARE